MELNLSEKQLKILAKTKPQKTEQSDFELRLKIAAQLLSASIKPVSTNDAHGETLLWVQAEYDSSYIEKVVEVADMLIQQCRHYERTDNEET